MAKGRFKLPKIDPALKLPLLKAGGVHLVLFVFLFVSFHSPQKAEVVEISIAPKPIQAKAVSSEDVKKLVEQKQKKIDDARRAEQQRKKRIQQERDRKRKAEQDRKRKAEQDKKRKAEEEKKRRDEELKKQQEAERKKREAEEAARKKREEEAARKRAEEQARIDAANTKRVLSERDKYTALIRNKISRNWIVTNKNDVCVLRIKLLSSGQINSVDRVSGQETVCRTAIAAVYKSEPLPVSKDPAVFRTLREIELTLDPQDN